MRWIEPEIGDFKIKKKFAILPIKIKRETRWLEWVTIEYRYYINNYSIIGWHKERFVDENKK